ncbi:UNVERIFIED_CONTAM: hypothetical protein K2H54_044828 [Gekko kuhli]
MAAVTGVGQCSRGGTWASARVGPWSGGWPCAFATTATSARWLAQQHPVANGQASDAPRPSAHACGVDSMEAHQKGGSFSCQEEWIRALTSEAILVSHPFLEELWDLGKLPGKNNILCLNVTAHSQIPALQYLLSDPDKGIQVTGQLGEKKQFKHFEVAYQKTDVKLNVSKNHIVLDDNGNATMLPWTTTVSFTVQGLKVIIEEEKSVSISGADNITIKISYVKFPERFLGLYFIGSENFSDQVTGLLGQFYFNTHFENPGFGNWRPIIVHGRKYDTSRQQKKDYRIESPKHTVSCWALDISP